MPPCRALEAPICTARLRWRHSARLCAARLSLPYRHFWDAQVHTDHPFLARFSTTTGVLSIVVDERYVPLDIAGRETFERRVCARSRGRPGARWGQEVTKLVTAVGDHPPSRAFGGGRVAIGQSVRGGATRRMEVVSYPRSRGCPSHLVRP